MIEHARAAYARGWTIFPLKPKSKHPLTAHGFKDATRDPERLKQWWAETPAANVAIAAGESNITVLDCDHGLANAEQFEAWRTRNNIPVSYTVHTGRRTNDKGEPEFGAQIYYAGTCKTTTWALDGVTGEIKSIGGYVLAAGCVHPISGERYEVLSDCDMVPVPDVVKNLKPNKPTVVAGGPVGTGAKIPRGQWHPNVVAVAGRLVNAGFRNQETLFKQLVAWIWENCAEPEKGIDEPWLRQIVHSTTTFEQSEKPGTEIEQATVQTRCALDIEAELIEWLWENKIPLGELTVFCGMPDCGKSSVSIDMAARVSRGEDFPDNVRNTLGPRTVLFMVAEDSLSHTVKPRLMAAGADLSRIHFVEKTSVTFKAKKSERMLALDTDMKALQEKVEALGNVALIIIDPLASYLGSIRKNEEKGVRAKLEELKDWAKEKNLAIVFLDHLNKNNSQDAMHRISGTGALSAVPRAVWLFARDEELLQKTEDDIGDFKGNDIPETKLMMWLKLNIIEDRLKRNLAFTHESVQVQIGDKFVSQPRIAWAGRTSKTPAELAQAKKRGPKDTIMVDCQRAVLKALKAGPMPSTALTHQLMQNGYKERMIDTARKNCGVVAFKQGGAWYARLKSDADVDGPTPAAPTSEAGVESDGPGEY